MVSSKGWYLLIVSRVSVRKRESVSNLVIKKLKILEKKRCAAVDLIILEELLAKFDSRNKIEEL